MTTLDFFQSTPHPPTTEDDQISHFRLLRSRRVGIKTYHRLLQQHGSASAALKALPEIARAAGVRDYQPCSEEDAERELSQGRKIGARPLFFGTPDYPVMLQHLPDAPPILWARGNITFANRSCVAIVGARNASSLGLRMSAQLAKELGESGLVVVSGLARGIDRSAHEASLRTGTIAVIAGGVDTIYPPEHKALTKQIIKHGLLLSERPPGAPAQARLFPARNRIVSGLSRALVVVEAAAQSGSLITARSALDQGREVLAVPGHPFDARAAGCNILLRDGALLVRSASDVLEALPLASNDKTLSGKRDISSNSGSNLLPNTSTHDPKNQEYEQCAVHNCTPRERLLQALHTAPISENQLIRDLDFSVSEISTIILELELDGKIERHPGGLLSLKKAY